jgi:hypothetical protein
VAVTFVNPVSVIECDPMVIGSDTPTLGGMVFLRVLNPAVHGKKYKIQYRWEPWATITALRAAQIGQVPVYFPIAGNAMIAADGGLPAPKHPVYGTEADPTQLVGGDMDIWDGEVIVISTGT